ncbi:hypothetical protein [Micromonospora sp. NBS 11-29]|uniref:hypothetical protein n=1 Tax=Micromonospora sp. NBS 11-29 TaxID=1960879 RepID=UPI000B780E78|nr:hypothetical protein [Micromonospora sp. NBS 11-29]
MTAPRPDGETAEPVRQDLVEFEQMLGGDTIRAVPQGTVEFGRPLAYEIGLECFPPGFRALSDAGDWRYVRVVLPVTIGLLPGRRELTGMTVRLRRAAPEALALDLEPPRRVGADGLPAVLGSRPFGVTPPPPPDGAALDPGVAVEVSGHGGDSLGWTLRDATGGTLPAGTYVLGAVLRLPPSATVLSGELSASTSMRRPYLDAFRLSRPRTRHPEPFAVPIAVRERDRPAVEAREPAPDETPEGTGSRRLCVAADTESYSSRDVRGQLDVQRRFVEVLETATRNAGLDRNLWTTQPQGDGELALLPLGLDEPRAVADLLRELAVALRHLNRGLVPQARLRLRVAVHTGMVYPGRNGFAGSAVVQVCRLRDSDDLRRTLREAASADLGAALSEPIYEELRQFPSGLALDRFVRVSLDIPEKGFRAVTWLGPVEAD